MTEYTTFAQGYVEECNEMMRNVARYGASFECRGAKIAREIKNATYEFGIETSGISIFSHPTHRVVPMRFILAEMCAMLAGSNDIATMETYNKGIRKYSNDGVTLGASYGEKLSGQLSSAIQRLQRDPYSRQACCVILQKEEMMDMQRQHIPCNVFLQFLQRDGMLILIVASRSSDFVTGFSIDTIHWQFLLQYAANSLQLVADRVCYNIGSLHIYEKDIALVKDWDVSKMYGAPYQHFIKTTMPIVSAIYECKHGFKGGMGIDELCDLLGIDGHGKAVARYNDEMFKLYRNKLER